MPAAPAAADPGWFGRPGPVDRPGVFDRRSLLAGLGAALVLPPPAFPFALPSRPAHAPRPSDVCFSSRWPRPEALAAARAFGATRLDWCYTHDAAFLSDCRRAGMQVLGGALNTTLPDVVGGTIRERGRIRDREGRFVTAPWMQRWTGVVWGCMNSPDYRRIFLAHAEAGLKAGIDWFMMDDSTGNFAAVRWGGCWCEHCRSRAAAEGVDLESDMVAFQRRSVLRFYADMRAEMARLAGRRVTLGFNCPANRMHPRNDWYYGVFDLAICEVDGDRLDPVDVAGRLAAAEIAGRPQGFTLRSRDVALNRRMAAWCYAHGGHMLCPWDVYLRSSGQGADRLFGDPKDYADIYGLARALGPLLDDAAPSALPPAGSWRIDRPGVRASLRAHPGGRFAVLHLVSWEGEGPMRIELDPRAAAGAREVAEAVAHVPGRPPVALARAPTRMGAVIPPATWVAIALTLRA